MSSYNEVFKRLAGLYRGSIYEDVEEDTLSSYVNKSKDPNTSSDILDVLSDFPDPRIKESLLDNPALNLPTLIKLSAHGLDVHRHPLINRMHMRAQMSNIPHPLLDQNWLNTGDSGKDKLLLHGFMRFALHPSASSETLETLIKHPTDSIVKSCLQNPSLPAHLLLNLARHTSPDIRVMVAKHPNTSSIVLRRLLDSSPAQQSCPELKHVAKSDKCSPDILDDLSQHEFPSIRRIVAKNALTPDNALSRLAMDSDTQVRGVVARNPAMTYNTLSKMVNDPDPDVRVSLAMSRFTPAKILDKLATDISDKVRYYVAANKNSAQSTLEKLSQDREAIVAQRVYRNPKTPIYAMNTIKERFKWK